MGSSEDSESKLAPSWQRHDPAIPESSKESLHQPSEPMTAPKSREPLVEQATKFLEDESIRDAPIERKRAFLVSKGLSEEEVAELLQEERAGVEHAPEAEVMEDYGIDKEEISQLQSAKITPDASTQQLTSVLPMESSRPSKDVAPIITYPEFLIHSHRPPPLITARRILTTFYAASGAAATIYGTSTYIVEPMIESLIAARHSLFGTAMADLDTLIAKLEGAVSKIPNTSLQPDADGSDIESIDSDPARFFSRSTATQTSPHLSRSTSATSSHSDPPLPIQVQESNVTELLNRLTDIQPTDATSAVKTSISDLQKYLDGLPNANAVHNGKMWEKSKADEYSKLKAEIRGVKGVLLSARNFPSSAAVR